MKRIYFSFFWGLTWMAWGIAGCATVPLASEGAGAESVKPLPAPPRVTRFFASPDLRPGETWKVYLIAADPGGEMKNMVCTIDQPGVGEYPVSITRIDGDYQKKLNGYIYLSTSTFEQLDGADLTLTVQIQDAAGQYSQPAKFHLTFNNLYLQESPPPGIFQDRDLGPIMVQVHGLREGGPSLFFRPFR